MFFSITCDHLLYLLHLGVSFSLYLRTLLPFPADLLNDVRAGGYGAEAGLISCRTEFLLLKKGLIGGLILN
jgi:hypothetical protein